MKTAITCSCSTDQSVLTRSCLLNASISLTSLFWIYILVPLELSCPFHVSEIAWWHIPLFNLQPVSHLLARVEPTPSTRVKQQPPPTLAGSLPPTSRVILQTVLPAIHGSPLHFWRIWWSTTSCSLARGNKHPWGVRRWHSSSTHPTSVSMNSLLQILGARVKFTQSHLSRGRSRSITSTISYLPNPNHVVAPPPQPCSWHSLFYRPHRVGRKKWTVSPRSSTRRNGPRTSGGNGCFRKHRYAVQPTRWQT